MKKRVLYLISIIMTVLLAVLCVCGCTKDGSNTSGNKKPNKPEPEDPPPTPRSVYLKVNGGSPVSFAKQSGSSAQTEIYSVKVNLAIDDVVTIYDNSDNTYTNYNDSAFGGTAKRVGEHTFELRISGSSGVIYVTQPSITDPTPTPRSVYLKVNGGSPVSFAKQSGSSAQTEIYSVKVNLAVDDVVTIYDNSDNTYTNYNDSAFGGTAKRVGEHTFELRISGSSGVIYVTQPSITPEPDKPKPTKTTVYFTNTNQLNWSNVYAYMWNSNVAESYKTKWPGDKLTSIGTSDYGEKQYSTEVDITRYDRIIFNDNTGNQTCDLTVSAASSGFFGVDEMFTYGTGDYGKVEYFTLKDSKNLSYISGASKKFSVYTPRGYTKDKKYGVLYMFDSQNLYIAATGAEKNHDDYGSWAVDVAVNNLVSNGGDGVIIVAIDNTDGYRNRDLTMSQAFGSLTSLADEDDYYDGHLEQLGDFMKETLMPWIKNKYSVDDRREKTGIAGSSSGGLAAYYLGLRDNDLYGYIGAFSPANGLFKTSDWNKFYNNKNFTSSSVKKPKIYVYCGENGDWLENMLLPATKEIKNLTSYGFAAADITENYVDGGTHSENYWRNAFAEFLGKYAW